MKLQLLYIYSRNPLMLIGIGLISTIYGIHLIIRGYKGDTLMPGTNFTYLPAWLFYATGVLLQLPLPLAYWYLHSLGRI